MTADLNRALERLTTHHAVIIASGAMVRCEPVITINKPLAALLENACDNVFCNICGGSLSTVNIDDDGRMAVKHAPDCAFVAMLQAINGEGL